MKITHKYIIINDIEDMEVTIVRFNRPLLVRMDKSSKDPFFQTVYGFVINEDDVRVDHHHKVDDYVGYLAGMHEFSNGSDWFSISYEYRGLPDWVDKKGKVHPKQDNWMERVFQKSIKKLNLSYTLIHRDMVDMDEYYDYLNEQNLIVDDTFFYDFERYQPYERGPFFEQVPDDELPF